MDGSSVRSEGASGVSHAYLELTFSAVIRPVPEKDLSEQACLLGLLTRKDGRFKALRRLHKTTRIEH
jgi:hypothetical protein